MHYLNISITTIIFLNIASHQNYHELLQAKKVMITNMDTPKNSWLAVDMAM